MKPANVFAILCTVLIILIILTGCGSGVVSTPVEQGEFRQYALAFEETARLHGRDLHGAALSVSIEFGNPEGAVTARCYFEGRIVIAKEAWEGISEMQRRVRMFHELGHCVLQRQHTDQPSIMNGQWELGAPQYRKDQEFYDSELFQ